MSRMRVLLDGRVISNRFPGIGRYTRNLAVALAESGLVDLQLLIDPSIREAKADLHALPQHPRIEILAVKAKPSGLRQHYQLLRLARRLSPDVWHSPWYMMPWLRLRCPLVVTFYDTIPFTLPRFWSAHQRILFKLAHRLSFRSMARGIVLSESAKRDLVRLLGAPSDCLELIPPGASQDFTPQKAVDVQRFKSAHGLDRDYLLYVGINKPSKNLVRLVRAYDRVRISCGTSSPLLVIAGPWDERYPESRQAVAEKGLGDWVRFLGTVAEPDLPNL